ncbi:unnamed protein product [Candidula unifasciata]|uniref:Homeobox domain-containing protein n=1 Tax=Candidula unifasciata TaxID=100452 RepID=A0A8S3YX56_9EUPU|nr:unnamed protein product [Candidula unifasciata]
MYRPTYPLLAVNQIDIQTTSKTVTSGHSSPMPLGSALCEDGHPFVSDPITGRKMCTCSLGLEVTYDPRSMMSDARKQGIALSGTIGGLSMGIDTSAFYPPLIRGIPVRHDRLPPYMTSGMPGQPLNFDPALAAHPYGLLYAGMDVNGGPIRKAATRETTGPLKIWLSEHKKNPYPTKAEKIMLAIITRMTLTQVSTWFANARRRLKKENKLYPADRENRDDDDDDDEVFSGSQREGNTSQSGGSDKRTTSDSDTDDINVDMSECSDVEDNDTPASAVDELDQGKLDKLRQGLACVETGPETESATDLCGRGEQGDWDIGHAKQGTDCGSTGGSPGPCPSNKPKIWSIYEIINGPSTANDNQALKKPSLQTHTHLALSRHDFPTPSALSMHKNPASFPFMNISSSLQSSPFSSSSSSLTLSTAFHPFASVVGAPSMLHHPPALTRFVSNYCTPISEKTSTLNRYATVAANRPYVDQLPSRVNSTETIKTEQMAESCTDEQAVENNKFNKYSDAFSKKGKHETDINNSQIKKATRPSQTTTSQPMNSLRSGSLSPVSSHIAVCSNETSTRSASCKPQSERYMNSGKADQHSREHQPKQMM